jgi:hypothetical protein
LSRLQKIWIAVGGAVVAVVAIVVIVVGFAGGGGGKAVTVNGHTVDVPKPDSACVPYSTDAAVMTDSIYDTVVVLTGDGKIARWNLLESGTYRGVYGTVFTEVWICPPGHETPFRIPVMTVPTIEMPDPS